MAKTTPPPAKSEMPRPSGPPVAPVPESATARVERIARACHEANRAYCASIGDTSQPPWESAPEWQKASARAGVEALIADPTLTSEQLHESWLAQKTADGWTYGAVKDADKKTHPAFLPYAELPAEQRKKDEIFGTTARALLDPRPTEHATVEILDKQGRATGAKRVLVAGQFFTTANRAAAGVTAEPFDPAVKPWPVGVVDDAASATHYSMGGGLNQPGAVVTPGDWIVTMASGERRPMSPLDFEATYSPLADAGEADSMALEKFLRRVPRPVLTVGVAADGVTFRLTSIDQSEVLEGVVEGNTFVVTPAPRTTNV